MKIAQIAPLYESVPPKFYGGTERVVSYLTEELVRQGHDVTLFASGDSKTTAQLTGCCVIARRASTPRGRRDLPDSAPFYDVFQELPLVAISNDQRRYLRDANWVGTVHHGLPCNLLPFQSNPSGGYLHFLVL